MSQRGRDAEGGASRQARQACASRNLLCSLVLMKRACNSAKDWRARPNVKGADQNPADGQARGGQRVVIQVALEEIGRAVWQLGR